MALPDTVDGVDRDPPDDTPDYCPNCGAAYTHLVPPAAGAADLGDHWRLCHIGSQTDGVLAGWAVVHR